MKKIKILNVVANYKNKNEVVAYIKNFIYTSETVESYIAVVDNSNDFNYSPEIGDLISANRVYIMRPGSNLGYYGAAKHAFDLLFLELKPDWVIVSNTDVFPMPDIKIFYSHLLDYNCFEPLVISPLIIQDSTGNEWIAHMKVKMNPYRYNLKRIIYNNKFTFWLYEIYCLIKRKYLTRFFHGQKSASETAHKQSMRDESIYAPAGAFTIFSKKYFENGGSFDYGSFMYGEEIFVAESSLEIGAVVLHAPRFQIVHIGYSTTNIFNNPHVLRFKQQSINYIYKNYYKR